LVLFWLETWAWLDGSTHALGHLTCLNSFPVHMSHLSISYVCSWAEERWTLQEIHENNRVIHQVVLATGYATGMSAPFRTFTSKRIYKGRTVCSLIRLANYLQYKQWDPGVPWVLPAALNMMITRAMEATDRIWLRQVAWCDHLIMSLLGDKQCFMGRIV